MLNDEDENGFWKVVDFERILPASGSSIYTNGCNQPPTFWSSAGNNTITGYYWSATKQDNDRVYGASFDAHDVLGNYSYPPGYGISVRLFKDAH